MSFHPRIPVPAPTHTPAPARIGLPCPGSRWSRSGGEPPRAGIDILRTPAHALGVIDIVMARPLRSETVVVALDADRCGTGIVVVHDTTSPDAVVDVVDHLVTTPWRPHRPAVVVATVRARGTMVADDADRWLDADARCAAAAVELVEWFVIAGDGINCPRQLVGGPSRW